MRSDTKDSREYKKDTDLRSKLNAVPSVPGKILLNFVSESYLGFYNERK